MKIRKTKNANGVVATTVVRGSRGLDLRVLAINLAWMAAFLWLLNGCASAGAAGSTEAELRESLTQCQELLKECSDSLIDCEASHE